MTKLVRTTADILYPFCMLYGFYIVAHGHLTPGGGFQGGAVIATATALLIVAHRFEDVRQRIRVGSMKVCESIGLLGFILAAGSAFFFGKAFFSNWLIGREGGLFATAVAFGANPGNLNTGGFLPIMNLAVGLEVLGALTVILLYMLAGAKGDTE
jgi:multicomponent Na+:H+ antiporter subunit B